MEPFEEIAVIGDITVKANEDFVRVLTDGDTVLFMQREAEFGLAELANALQSLVK